MASIPTEVACPLPPQSAWGRLSLLLNTSWHKYALWAFAIITLGHWAEHLFQAFQIYVLGWPPSKSFGAIGMLYPALVKTEVMHYGYAIVMLVLLWVLRKGFTGRSYVWWMVAFWIQFWHHIEHALLQYQAAMGPEYFFLGAPQPISLIQMLGYIEGTPKDAFNNLLYGPPKHDFTWLMLMVRRVEVHLFYNTIVFVPMVVAMYLHMFPSPQEEQHMGCGCALFPRKKGLARMVVTPVT